MPARSLHIVAYDIASARRLRQALVAVRAYAGGGQKSVHECHLTAVELIRLTRQLTGIARPATDRLFTMRLDPRMQPRLMGIARPASDSRFLIIG